MDMINELKFIKDNRENISMNIDILTKEKEFISQKIHILNVLNIIKDVEEIAELIKEEDVSEMNFFFYNDSDSPPILFTIIKNNNEDFEYYNKPDFIYGYLQDKLTAIEHRYLKRIDFKIDLSENIKEQILKYFLTDEMKKILDYSEMTINLETNHNAINKKVKL